MNRKMLCGWLVGWALASNGWGQDATQTLAPRVAVMDASQADAIRLLAADLVEVRSLEHAAPLAVEGYERINERLLQLRDWTAFVCGDRHSNEPAITLWQERLSNQGVRIAIVAQESHAAQLKQIHRLLCDLLPRHRKTLDANLDRALQRHRHDKFGSPTEQLANSP